MPQKLFYKNPNQKDAYSSPWSLKEAILIRIWECIWNLLVRWLPKPFYRWHILLLKLFRCKISGSPYIAPTCRIYAPWLLSVGDKSALGSRSEIYNLGPVHIGNKTTLAQYTYVCNGTHDFNDEKLPLLVGVVNIGNNVFVGAKSIILPGLTIGNNCILGAGSVLTKDMNENEVWAGNPAKLIKTNRLNEK